MKKDSSGRPVFAHITIGLQLAITMLIFVYGGHRLDLYYKKSPVFLLIGTVLGMCLGFYHLMKDLSKDNKDNKKSNTGQEEEKEEKKRIRWN